MLDGKDPYRSFTGEYRYPPLVAVFYAAVARLPETVAAIIMLTLNTLLAAAGILLAALTCLERTVPSARRVDAKFISVFLVALIATLLNVDKLRGELQMIQTNALMFFMFAVALYYLDRRPSISGLALAVVFNVKFLSAAFIPYLLIRKRYKAAFSMIVFSGALMFLPLPIVGWHDNIGYIKSTFGGIARISGILPASKAREAFESINTDFSCSLTSSFARAFAACGMNERFTWLIVAVVLTAIAIHLARQYRRANIPLIAWPDASRQSQTPYGWVSALEWGLVISFSVMFSPQTNTRHLFLTTAITTVLAALLVTRHKGESNQARMLLVGGLVLALGYSMPPSFYGSVTHAWAVAWLQAGGACWCLLVTCIIVASVGLGALNSRSDKASPDEPPSA